MSLALECGIRYLIEQKPYYAQLLMQMRRIPTEELGGKPFPTAGINIKDGTLNLYYNPKFLDRVLENEGAEGVAGVLMHEAQHVTHLHLSNRQKGKNKKLFNIAADAEINQLNELISATNLAKTMNELSATGKSGGIVTLASLRKMTNNKALAPREIAEYYYAALNKDSKKEEKDQSEGEEGHGDHDVWEDGEQNEEIVKQVSKNAMEKASNRVGRGNTPSEILTTLDKLNKNTLNWRSVLRNFVARQIDVTINADRRKRHKRYGIAVPGYRKKTVLNLAVIKDTSGSVSDEALAVFESEINKMHKTGIKITVIDCDADVQQVYKYSPNKKPGIKGRGGTTFSPALKKAEEIKADACVFFTDGFGESDIYKPKCPVLWAVCDEHGLGHLPKRDKKILVTV